MSGPLDFGHGDEDRERASEPAPPAHTPPPVRSRGPGRYTWVVGIVAVLLLSLITLNAVNRGGAAPPGGPQPGARLPPFAVPLAGAPPRADGKEDANVNRKTACTVRGPGILNVCDEYARAPVVIAVFPTTGARCRAPVLDQFDRATRFFGGRVRFLAVGSRGKRRTLAGRHAFPVGWDRDGGLATAYGLVGCPQITFARRGGAVVETTRRPLSDRELGARVRRLLR